MKPVPVVTVVWKLVMDNVPVIAGKSAGRNYEAAKLKALVDCVAWTEAAIPKVQAASPEREHHQSRD